MEAETMVVVRATTRTPPGLTERLLIADVINRRIAELGLSNSELARLTGMSQSYISNLRNSHENPTLDTLAKVAHALEIRVVDLFNRQKD